MSCQHRVVTAIIASLTLITVTACASHKPPTELRKATVQKQRANTLTHWEIRGAMAARNNKKGWTATFNWVQRSMDEYQIRLFGPLGGGTVLINRTNGLTTFRDGPHVSSSRDADRLLQQKTGIALPVANLYYWARGLPAPGPLKTVKYDSLKHVKSFQQAGYTVEYLSTMTVNNINLPKQIKLQGNGIRIKVAIKKWKI